jgi:ABC-type spermidine/putrescine transport system permease subunit I
MALASLQDDAPGGKVSAGLRLRAALGRWMFHLPVVFMVVFFAVPMALTVLFSVFERTMFWMEPGFTLFSYENFFFSARLTNFLESMKYSAIAVAICFVLGFPIAVFVRRGVPQVAQHRVILLFILPFMVSEIIRVFALRPVLQRNGIVNTALMDLGLIDEPITALLYTHTGVVIGEVLSFLPFIVFAGFLAMEAVPKYIFEVCDDLGVGPVARFRDVILRRRRVHLRQRPRRGAAAQHPRRRGRGERGADRHPGHRGDGLSAGDGRVGDHDGHAHGPSLPRPPAVRPHPHPHAAGLRP